MYSYTSMPLSFRLAAWPYGGNSYVTTYNTDRYDVDIRVVLDYVAEQLRKTPIAFVFKTTFSLINFYSMFTDTSMGLTMEPAHALQRGPMTLTFARTKDINIQEPAHISWQTHKTAIWGKTPARPVDFITISLPLVICARARMQQLLEFDHKGLYNIIGAYSKAVVMAHHPTPPSMIVKKTLFSLSIPRAMWAYAIEDWKYTMEFWKRIPDLLTVEFDPLFLEYYCREIAPNLPDRKRSKYYAMYEEQAVDHIRAFILRYLQNKILPGEENLVSLLPSDETLLHDVETLSSQLAKGIIA